MSDQFDTLVSLDDAKLYFRTSFSKTSMSLMAKVNQLGHTVQIQRRTDLEPLAPFQLVPNLQLRGPRVGEERQEGQEVGPLSRGRHIMPARPHSFRDRSGCVGLWCGSRRRQACIAPFCRSPPAFAIAVVGWSSWHGGDGQRQLRSSPPHSAFAIAVAVLGEVRLSCPTASRRGALTKLATR